MLTETRYPTFADALWPATGLIRDLLLVVGGSVLVAALAQLSTILPVSPVPITGQTLGVLLIGALLGSRRGALSMLAYIAEGAAGMPVFANATAGPAVLVGPTGGYLAGFVAAAFVVGWLCERGWDRRLVSAASAMVIGNLVIYLFGISWLQGFVGTENVLAAGVYPFIIGDLLKVASATILLPSGWYVLHRTGDRTL